jgi:hypothetical protein
MSVTDLTGIIAAIASLGALAPLAAEVTQWHSKHPSKQHHGEPVPWALLAFIGGAVTFSFAAVIIIFGLTTSLAMSSPSVVSLRTALCVLSFLTVLTGSLGTARALHDRRDGSAVLGGAGMLAGFGVLFAMIAIG